MRIRSKFLVSHLQQEEIHIRTGSQVTAHKQTICGDHMTSEMQVGPLVGAYCPGRPRVCTFHMERVDQRLAIS